LNGLGASAGPSPTAPTSFPTRRAERADYGAVVLEGRLCDALARLNPDLPSAALDDAFRRLTRPEGATPEARNRAFHRLIVDGVTVEYRHTDGAIRGAQARALDFDDPDNNRWLAINQLTVVENKHERRPDIVLFVNGLPLGLIELKNPTDEEATVWTAWQQFQTYKAELPSLFAFNAALIVSDGMEARIGTLTAGREWFKPWRTISGEVLADTTPPQLQVMLAGAGQSRRFLALIRDFIVFEDDGSGAPVKKVAGYHQFHTVEVAVAETLRAAEMQQAAGLREETDIMNPAASRAIGASASLAHARGGQEPDHGLLCRAHRPRAGDGEPDHRGAHRPQRSRRPTLRHFLPLPGYSAATAGPGRKPGGPPRETRG